MQHHKPTAETPRQIEARLDQDRDALSASLAALSDKLSFNGLFAEGSALVKSNAGPYTQALDAAVRANPLALAVSAVGLAWLVLGRRSEKSVDPTSLAGTKYEAETRWEDEGGPVADLPETDAPWMEEADRLRLRASKIFARINMAVRDNLAPAAELAKNRADVTASLTKDLRRVMSRGLENLSDHARNTALAARERAYSVRIAAGKVGAETVRDNPLVAGLALAAAGATLAALLPQSTTENEMLGLPRDRVVGEAKRILGAERRRVAQSVERVAQALSSDIAPKDGYAAA